MHEVLEKICSELDELSDQITSQLDFPPLIS